MNRWRGKIAVVTGANSGIGKAVTHHLLANGINVVGLDVNTNEFVDIEKKNSASGNMGHFHGLQCDVSRESSLQQAFDFIINEYNGVDILVNSAGIVNYERIIDSNWKNFEQLLNINVLAVAFCIRITVKSLRDRCVEGHIFNVNSTIGHEIPLKGLSDLQGSDSFNLYPTCKHATVAMTHSVRRELVEAKLPIRITSISPGLVKTNITKSTNLKNLFEVMPALEPDDIAEALLYALGTRPEVQITELTIRRTGEP